MSFLPKHQPRQFNYKPRVFRQGEEEQKVRFQRKTIFDPHQHSGKPTLLLGVVVAVVVIIYFLGGIKKQMSVPMLTEENVVTVTMLDEIK